MPNFISENQIEQALVQKLQHLHGFDALDCYTEDREDLLDGSGRANKRDELRGKLGVFWHTQGSGKSFSMIFYVHKIFRKQTGNSTFVVVTDRDDLDGQIYRNFLHTGTGTKAEAAQPI